MLSYAHARIIETACAQVPTTAAITRARARLGPEPLRAVFIRAPWIEKHGPDVQVLASLHGHPVAVREEGILLCAFHPELTDDSRVHALLMAMATSARTTADGRSAGR